MEAATIRSEVLDRAVVSLGALDGVEAIYLSGSLAENNQDEYSDIDLRVIVADGTYESVLALREHLPTTWGPFLFHQTIGEIFTVTYYDSLTKADVFYYAAGAVTPSPWFNVGTKVLIDRTGHLRSILAASETLHFRADSQEIVHHLQTCIAGLIESAKRVRRGETIYASRLCAEAVHHVLIADDLLSRRPPLGSSKRERLVPSTLTEIARTSTAMPTITEAKEYYSALSMATEQVLSQAESDGFCTDQTVTRLRTALDQLVILAGETGVP
jgi:predicted nucleotidyltransferase